MRKDRSRTLVPNASGTEAGTPSRPAVATPWLWVEDSPATSDADPGLSPRLDEITDEEEFKKEQDRYTNYLMTYDFTEPEMKEAAIARWKDQLDQLHLEWPVQLKVKDEIGPMDEDGQGAPELGGFPEGVGPKMAEEDRAAHEKFASQGEGNPATDDGGPCDMKIEELLGTPGKRKRFPGVEPAQVPLGEERELPGPAELPRGDGRALPVPASRHGDPALPVPAPMGDTQVFAGPVRFNMASDDGTGTRTPTEEFAAEPQSVAELQPMLTSMVSKLSMQISDLGANLNNKINDADAEVKKLATKIDQQKEDVMETVTNMVGDPAAASVQVGAETEKDFKSLAARLEVLEGKGTAVGSPLQTGAPATAPRRQAGSSPPQQPITPPLNGPLQRKDPWSGWKEPNAARTPTIRIASARSPPTATSARSPPTATSYDFDALKEFKPTPRWTPRQVEVKGWCRFEETVRGLNRDEA